MILLAYFLLAFGVTFFAVMSALIIHNAHREARKVQDEPLDINPKSKPSTTSD